MAVALIKGMGRKELNIKLEMFLWNVQENHLGILRVQLHQLSYKIGSSSSCILRKRLPELSLKGSHTHEPTEL